jgi:hypothetical protein
MSTPAQIVANQVNALLSTGPTSAAGKSKSSLNAVKTGLTGRTVLLSSEDAALYEQHVTRFMQQYEPEGDEEQTLVQSLADTQWRLLRIPSLEAGIYALGRIEFAELFAGEDESVRPHLINAKTLLVYQRQLNNLNLQESRLRRQREKTPRLSSNYRTTASNKQLARRPRVATRSSTPQPASTSTPCERSARNSSIRPNLGSNFHFVKLRLAPGSSFPISSPPLSNARPHNPPYLLQCSRFRYEIDIKRNCPLVLPRT